ncbi:MAG: CRISPR-associated helicase Cas3', partial [Deltaproteobacteria bacterium]
RLKQDGISLPTKADIPESLYGGLDKFHAASMLDIRMLFSALVDADFIETEAHFNPAQDGSRSYRRSGPDLSADTASEILSTYLEKLALTSNSSMEVRQVRQDLLTACFKAASQPTGLFTLTAPTGAGKTLSMLAFAVKHAELNKLRRIITVIPYLSIIEQTALEYRKVFSSRTKGMGFPDYILEDHSLASATRPRMEDDGNDNDMEVEALRSRRLLAENWDAPIIVTTTVQLLESLFANRSSACRKLHRLAQSVILFDEVQTLPVTLAIPTLATISRLVERYGASVVFSTATQPAFSHLDSQIRKYCPSGWSPQEIAPKELRLFEHLKRTEVVWPENFNMTLEWTELAERIGELDQVLCIVNLKKHALLVYDELERAGAEGLFHLSTNMCPAHRRDVLETVRQRLKEGASCKLVSTQCVEAGVDLDFPVVFRAWAPLDSMAQAAGRCNRHGLGETGQVHVFIPQEEGYPDGAYEQAASVARIVLNRHAPENLVLDNPRLFQEYFHELYSVANLEKKDLKNAIERQDFSAVASLYRIISNDAINVLTPYRMDRFVELKKEVRETGLTASWISRARDYSVGLFRPKIDLPVQMFLEPVRVGFKSKSEDWFIYLECEHYSDQKGLTPPQQIDCLIA